MSETFAPIIANNSALKSEAKRAAAVAAALDLIHAYAGSGNQKFSLSAHMKMLSTYADQIQAALKVK
ncbi:conserved hypothetical protein [Pseudomonas sp. IT-P100]|uniref:hypothetical protein n=1 Tax=Pseudomonas sp. IT-P100 TaxID=3026452 RepID=UPI0039E0CA31